MKANQSKEKPSVCCVQVQKGGWRSLRIFPLNVLKEGCARRRKGISFISSDAIESSLLREIKHTQIESGSLLSHPWHRLWEHTVSMCLFHQKGLVLLMWAKEISFGHFVLCFQVLQETHVASSCNLTLFFIGLKIQPRYHNERGRIGTFYNGVVFILSHYQTIFCNQTFDY